MASRGYEVDDKVNQRKWTKVAKRNGSIHLLKAYRELSAILKFKKKEEDGRSVHLAWHTNSSPIISVHPEYSSGAIGLRFGVSITNLRKINIIHLQDILPEDFLFERHMHKENEWSFGYIRDNLTLTETMLKIAKLASSSS